MSSGKNFDLNVVPPEEGSKGIIHSFDLNVIPPVDEDVTCELIRCDTYGIVDDTDASRREEYQVSVGRGKRKLMNSESAATGGTSSKACGQEKDTREGSEECYNLPPKPQLPHHQRI